MFCPYCGYEIEDESYVFCKNCGKKVKEEEEQPEIGDVSVETNINQPASQQFSSQQSVGKQSAIKQPVVQQPVVQQPASTAPVLNQVQSAAPAVPGNVNVTVKTGGHKAVWIPIISVILIGAIVAVCMFFFKSDEQKIRDRIDTFFTACGETDIEGMVECLDSKTRKTYETMMGLTQGLLGGITGFDLPLGDMFELYAMDSSESFEMDYEIGTIKIDGKKATAKVTMKNGNGESETSDVVLCKEDDDWFIDLEGTTGEELRLY